MIRLIAACSLIVAASWSMTRPTEETGGASRGVVVRMSVGELAQRSDLIVEGIVTDTLATETSDGLIVTESLLEVERTFHGEPSGSRTIRLPGGVLPDGRGMLVPGMPTLAQGERVLLFLAPEAANGMRTVMGLSQGKFRVVESALGERSLIRNGAHTALFDGASCLEDAPHASHHDYATVVSEIHAALAERSATEVK